MSNEIRVPDIGDFDAVDVIEVLISAGDTVEEGQSVLVLESDKASMEVPAETAGTVDSVAVKVGDQVKQGDLIAVLTAASAASSSAAVQPEAVTEEKTVKSDTSSGEAVDLVVPDIGDFDSVDVIEVNVAVGDKVQKDQALITLESDKASMEVPAEGEGIIISLNVKVGDKVSKGSVIGRMSIGNAVLNTTPVAKETKQQVPEKAVESVPGKPQTPAGNVGSAVAKPAAAIVDENAFSTAHASPAIRKLARELGVDLGKVSGSGRKGRITEDDVKNFVKAVMTAAPGKNTAVAAPSGSGIPPVPAVDFSQFGEIEEKALSRINVLTGAAMTRCWLNIPHVTQHDYADITELEAFRKSLKTEAEKRGVRVTLLAFLMKALAVALKELPRFNSSLAPDGKSLIMKKYYNIGVAVDTPNGLVVPVIRAVNEKGIYELSEDLTAMSKKARDGKLSPKDMSGASMTISSLGGIGGRFFTPIVNAPEVAILGVSRSVMQPVWNGKDFVPRLMLPMSLSYDHRVIDGAAGARMTSLIGQLLSDMKRTLL